MRAAARPGARDDVHDAIAVEIRRRDGNTALEEGAVGIELADQSAAGDLGIALELTELGAIDDLDVGSPSSARAGNDFGDMVVALAKGDIDAAGEAGIVRIKLADEGAG